MQDRGDIVLEAHLTGEKGFYDCPIQLSLYGPSNAAERINVENSLKADKLIKAGQLKQTRKEADAKRALTGLRNGGSTTGFGSHGGPEQPPEITIEDILQSSEAIDPRKAGDAVQTLAVDEDSLMNLPNADQPAQVESKLLPYQLQVSCNVKKAFVSLKLTFNRAWPG